MGDAVTTGARWDVGLPFALASEVIKTRWVNILEDKYGVVTGTGVGTSVARANSAGINAAAATGGPTGVVFCPSDVTIEIYDPVQFGGHVHMTGASFNWVGPVNGATPLLVRSYDGGAIRLYDKYIYLPNLTGVGNVWVAASPDTWGTTTGPELCNLEACTVNMGRVWGFATGLSTTSRDAGAFTGVTIGLGDLHANKIGVWLFCGAPGNDYVADNLFLGGGISAAGATTDGLAGTYGIRLDTDNSHNAMTNNVFVKPSLQGTFEYMIFLKRSEDNEFHKPRLESQGPSKVRFDELAYGNVIVSGAGSYINHNQITIEHATGVLAGGGNQIRGVLRRPDALTDYRRINKIDRADGFSFGPLIPGVANAGGTFSIDPTTATPGIKAGPGTNPSNAAEVFDTELWRSSADHWYTPDSFEAGTLVLPASATPAQTGEGSVVWDSDDDHLTVGTGAGRKTLANSDDTLPAAVTFLSIAKWGVS